MIGSLRTRVAIYHAVAAPDALGGAVTSWPLWAGVWASLKMLPARESRENGRLTVSASYRVVIRYQDGFPERARVKWGERTLRVITASDPDMRRERLHLICEEEQQ